MGVTTGSVPVIAMGSAGAAGAGGSSDEVLVGRPPIRGDGFKRSLATGSRLTIEMLGPFASPAPEPTSMTTLGTVEPAGAPPPRLGTPVMFPGSAPEIPPPPGMTNGVLIGAR